MIAVLLLALSVPALPMPDLLGILGPGSAPLLPTRLGPHTVEPSPRSSVSPATKPTLATSQYHPTPTPTPTPTTTTSAEPTVVQTTLVATSVLPASAESHGNDRSSRTWQIIGITIIAVLFVAASITCAMLFDRFWRFLKDVARSSCTSRPILSEEFTPDREKQSYTGTFAASARAIRPRELPWNTDPEDWNTLHRHPSRRNDHPPPV